MEGRGEAGVNGVVVVRAGDRTEDPLACTSIAEDNLATQLLLHNAASDERDEDATNTV
jgi:hypothetical protein